MGGQGRVGTEAPPALVADVRGVYGMRSHVPGEFRTRNESFPTLGAAVRPLPRVDPLVRVARR